MSPEHLGDELRSLAYEAYTRATKQKVARHFYVYTAYQEAALFLLEEKSNDEPLRRNARHIRRERYGLVNIRRMTAPDPFPTPKKFLNEQTFFTKLALRPPLREKLWPDQATDDFVTGFRRRELRKELLSAAARLGHSFIDLWILAANRLGISSGKSKDEDAIQLVDDYLNLLESQSTNPKNQFEAYHELNQISENFDLILAVNFPGIRELDLIQLPRPLGAALGRQTPVGGMSGGVNQTLVKKFRMPGYPLVMVTTDVLQEGEDLHTFCARVLHYGISWTTSAMEQRTGRVDRIRSLTHRKLNNKSSANPKDLLQVYYPHLKDTVELLQIQRVYERMNRFIRMMHRSITGQRIKQQGTINTAQAFAAPPRDIEPIRELLATAFPVRDKWLRKDLPIIKTKAEDRATEILAHFQQMMNGVESRLHITKEPSSQPWVYLATVYRKGYEIMKAGNFQDGYRVQPLTLFLRTVGGEGKVFLRCVSPVGVVPQDDYKAIERIGEKHGNIGFGKVCAVADVKLQTYNLTIEADILFDVDTTQVEEVINLVIRTCGSADALEHALLGHDLPMAVFRHQLTEEAFRA